MPERKFRTTLVIETDNDPTGWSLGEFHSAIENDEGDLINKAVVRSGWVKCAHACNRRDRNERGEHYGVCSMIPGFTLSPPPDVG